MSRKNNKYYLSKAVWVDDFDESYYKRIKDFIVRKIGEGEIEWIYAYGERLIKDGERQVLAKVRELMHTREFDNPYINPQILCRKCKKIIGKYGM